MNSTPLATALLGAALFASAAPAHAACNSICRQKCEQTAARGGNTVAECIKLWSYINGRYGARSRQFEGGARWNSDLCSVKCKIKWHRLGYSSLRACVRENCSQYGR